MSVEIPIRNRHGETVAVALVDDDEADLARWNWRFSNGYAVRAVGKGKDRFNLGMHREIMGLTRGDKLEVDHRNRDPLDNRRVNLRAVTHGVNQQNFPALGGSSKYRGVHWYKRDKRWKVEARKDGGRVFLGYFDDELEAARVASDWRRENLPGAVEEALA